MTIQPGVHDFAIPQGATFAELLTWQDECGTPIDLTDFKAHMQAKTQQASPATILDLSTDNGGITLGGTAGTIALSVAATDTSAIAPGTYDYDLALSSPDGTVIRLIGGVVTVGAEVTA